MKTKTNLVALMILVSSCSKESTIIHSAMASQTQDKLAIQASGHYIGERYGGGIIFYIDTSGQHGLIADTVDLSKAIAWWNGFYVTTGATGVALGTGADNTKKIVIAEGKTGRYAALKCANYKGSGYTDWYLPSKAELSRLYLKKNIIGGFQNTGYWSSTESSVFFGYAWYQDFTTGTQDNLSENNGTINVRPIRLF